MIAPPPCDPAMPLRRSNAAPQRNHSGGRKRQKRGPHVREVRRELHAVDELEAGVEAALEAEREHGAEQAGLEVPVESRSKKGRWS